jgi:MFS transporter, DHA2 family, glioxin efflux transporter
MYILPLYFQSIRGATPTNSGVHLLPLILSMSISSIVAAAFITLIGLPYYVSVFGTVLATIGAGLVYTLDVDTPSPRWIGFLILLGVGYGPIVQLGIIVGQASSKAEDIPVATAAINCTPLSFQKLT